MSNNHSSSALTGLEQRLLRREEYAQPALSPSGKYTLFVKSTSESVSIVVFAAGREKVMSEHVDAQIRDVTWAPDDSTIYYLHRNSSSTSWALGRVRVDGEVAVLPSLPAGSVIQYRVHQRDGERAVVVVRSAGQSAPSIWSLNGDKIARYEVGTSPPYYECLFDGDLTLRGGVSLSTEGSAQLWLSHSGLEAERVHDVSAESLSDFRILGFAADGSKLYLLSSQGLPTRSLLEISSSGSTTLYSHDRLDIDNYPLGGPGVWSIASSGSPIIVSVFARRIQHIPLSVEYAEVLSEITAAFGREPAIVGISSNGEVFLLADVRDDRPMKYFKWRSGQKLQYVATNRPDLSRKPLARLEDFSIPGSSGGSDEGLSGYYMRPVGATEPRPAVVIVHGGPAARDIWRFDSEAQIFAARGYVTVHVNFRGSFGFGKAFRAAGDGEWGTGIQADIYDAISYLSDQRVLDRDRVAMYGISFGGYAALLGGCSRPDLVRCTIAINPITDLGSLTRNPPAYWRPLKGLLGRQIGAGLSSEALRSRSPVHLVARESAPMLLVCGEEDRRISLPDFEAFVRQSDAVGARVKSLRFADEGHTIAKRQNREKLFASMLNFLSEHLA